MARAAEPSLVGVDLNGSRVRAAAGPAGGTPHPLPLNGGHAELPLALSLEKRSVQVGRAGLAVCRRLPHMACLDFLAHLGTSRGWAAGRHALDAARALTLVLEHLRPAWAAAQGLALAVPAYLDPDQVTLLTQLAEKAGARGRSPPPRVLGTVPTPLAAALTAYAEQPWYGLALVVDVDVHALTWAAVLVADGRMLLLDAQPLRRLGLRAWKERLLDAVADRCIRQSRRDPRDSAAAEQALFEQLDAALDRCRQGQPAELVIQTTSWYQHLSLRPEEVVGFCAPLVRQGVDGLRAVLAATEPHGPPSAVLLTADAGRLPGLAAALEENVGGLAAKGTDEADEDFGADLLRVDAVARSGVGVLPPDAVARAAFALAAGQHRGHLPRGHLGAAPLPPPQPADPGPAQPARRIGQRS
jgi:hypothetical protein